MKRTLFIAFAIAVLSGCKSKDPEPEETLQPYENEQLSGGDNNTTFDFSENAFSFQSPAMNGTSELEFFVGNSFFNQNWVSAPSSTTARDGLGPTFNATSCSGCHFKDGRGRPLGYDGENSNGFLVRLSVNGEDEYGGPVGHPNYGKQLNDRAILGVDPEGRVRIRYMETTGSFADGETYSLRTPQYEFYDLNFGAIDASVLYSPRIGQQMIGLGLLEAIKEDEILANADEFDTDGNGISGKPNMVWNHSEQKTMLGRFGWKANEPTISQQVAGALLGDLGITTSLFPDQNCPDGQTGCQTSSDGGAPEIENDDLHKMVIYSSNLAVPARRDVDDKTVLTGRDLFVNIGCNSCHKQSYTTGTHPTFANLSNQKIWPYTDLLLHDMGDDLADHRPDFLANGNEWRTQPLWGIGLIQAVNGHTFLLHDGRARNITEAILWHGGEAAKSRDNFKNLSKSERDALIAFINSL